MLSIDELLSKSQTVLQNPDYVHTQAVSHQRQSFPLHRRQQELPQTIFFITMMLVGGSTLTTAVLLIPPDAIGLKLASVLAILVSMFVAATATATITAKVLQRRYRPRWLTYQAQHPIDDTVQVVTAVERNNHSATVTTALEYAGKTQTIESFSVDLADEESLKTIAQCRVRNENVEQILQPWVNGDVHELPTVDTTEQERQQQLQTHLDHQFALAQHIVSQDILIEPTRSRG